MPLVTGVSDRFRSLVASRLGLLGGGRGGDATYGSSTPTRETPAVRDRRPPKCFLWVSKETVCNPARRGPADSIHTCANLDDWSCPRNLRHHRGQSARVRQPQDE